jgi:hypothetical protein
MAERLQGVNHRLGDQADAAFGASEAPGVEFGVLADHQAGRDVHPSVDDHLAQARAADDDACGRITASSMWA